MHSVIKQVRDHLGIICVLTLFIVVSIFMISQESLTFDERVNIQEGLNNVVRRSFDIEPYNPPLIREFAVIPLVSMGILDGENLPTVNQIFWSRMVIVLLGTLLITSTYAITLRMSNKYSALFAALLLFFDPQILAHSHYITPDIGSTLFLLLAWWSVITISSKPAPQKVIVVGLLIGLLAVSKIPAFIFFILFVCCYLLLFHKQNLLQFIFFHSKKIMLSLSIIIITIWASYGFGFSPIIKPSTNDQRVSNKVIQWAERMHVPIVQESIQLLKSPLPLGEYIGILKNTLLRGRADRIDFFLGNYQPGTWYFLPIMFVLKTPFSLLIIWVSALGVLLSDLLKRQHYHLNYSINTLSTTNTTIALLLMVGIIIVGTLVFNTPPLARYLINVLPFLAVISGIFLGELFTTKMGKATIFLLCAGLIVSVFQWFPHPLTYANNLISYLPKSHSQDNEISNISNHDQAKIYLLSDSNLDWGQGLVSLSTYIRNKKPEIVSLSYFGRDDATRYGFHSTLPWGSHKADEICAFHQTQYSDYNQRPLTIISVTNWHGCGYKQLPEYKFDKVVDLVGDLFLVFYQ